MHKFFIDIIGAIFFISFGLFLSIFHKTIGRLTAKQQYKILHIRFNSKGYQISFIFVGIIFIVLGVLSLFQIIKL